MGTFPAYPLLEIFSFKMDQAWEDTWHALAHVCQRWLYVVLGSPSRLNLRLLSTTRRPVRAENAAHLAPFASGDKQPR